MYQLEYRETRDTLNDSCRVSLSLSMLETLKPIIITGDAKAFIQVELEYNNDQMVKHLCSLQNNLLQLPKAIVREISSLAIGNPIVIEIWQHADSKDIILRLKAC